MSFRSFTPERWEMARFLRTPRLTGVAAASSGGAVPGHGRTAARRVLQAQGADLAITSAIDAHIETAKASPATPRRKHNSRPVMAANGLWRSTRGENKARHAL